MSTPPLGPGSGSELTTSSQPEFPVRGQSDLIGSEGGESVNVRRLLAALLRYKWLIAVITVAGGGLSVLAVNALSPEYTTHATLWIEGPSAGSRLPGGNQTQIQPIQPSALLGAQAWLDLLRSHVVLDSVVMARRLYVLPMSRADSARFQSFELLRDFEPGAYRLEIDEAGRTMTLSTTNGRKLETKPVGEVIGRTQGFLWRPVILTPGRRTTFKVMPPRTAAENLASQLQVHLQQQGNFMRVELSGSNPVELAATVNAVAERFVQVAAELKRDKVLELERILAEQVRQAGVNLRAADSAFETFRVRTITLPADGQAQGQNTIQERFFDMKFELEELRRDREQIARVLENLKGGAEVPVLPLELLGTVNGSSELKQVLGQLTQLRSELRTARRQYTDEHETTRKLLEQIATLETRTVPGLLENLQRQTAARERELNARMADASSELEDIPARVREQASLERHVTAANELYSTLLGRYEEARVAAATSIPDVSILDPATPPNSPIEDRRRQIQLMLILASLGVALAAAIGLDRIDPRLRYPEQVTELGLVTLGAVPHVQNGKGLRGTNARRLAAEAFRSIRMNLTHSYGSAGPMLITVSSPGPGDGKSFISINVAHSFAESGQRTLVIDGDLRRGTLHEMLGGRRKPGLTNYLLGLNSWDEILQPTANPSLFFIASGVRHKSAPELLGGKAMGELLSAALRAHFGVIIVDSPPLAAGVDPLVLSTWTRNLLVVMRTGNTNRELAGVKLEAIHRLPIRLLGAVLNDMPSDRLYRYYSYLPGYEIADDDADQGRHLTAAGVVEG